jgi:hypothetical protein
MIQCIGLVDVKHGCYSCYDAVLFRSFRSPSKVKSSMLFHECEVKRCAERCQTEAHYPIDDESKSLAVIA